MFKRKNDDNMTKLKLKKKAKNLLIMIILAFIILLAGIIKGIDFYKQKQYEKTYEYKLINVGYSKEDANILEKKLTNNDLEYLLTIEENSDIISLVNDKYFIQTNFQKYLDFSKSNRDYNMRKVVEYVNIGRYNEFYENTSPTDIKKEELMLVNKYHYLKEDYIHYFLGKVQEYTLFLRQFHLFHLFCIYTFLKNSVIQM